MDQNITGFILSYLFVFIIIGIATLLVKKELLGAETTRKIVHIGVSNWWLIAMAYFDNPWYPSIGALSFIIINYISYRFRVFRAMEAENQRDNLGTVYFPVSLLVLSIACFGGYAPLHVGAVGILVMGYGDGMASIVGANAGRHYFTILGNRKSLEGSAAMFFVSVIIIWLISITMYPSAGILVILLVSLAATVTEAFTPFGLDNLTVPLASSLVYYFML